MTIKDTASMMVSVNYKERFLAEYIQLRIRRDNLAKMLVKFEAGTLQFRPDTPEYILRDQLNHMEAYLHDLLVRAEFEKIELEDDGND